MIMLAIALVIGFAGAGLVVLFDNSADVEMMRRFERYACPLCSPESAWDTSARLLAAAERFTRELGAAVTAALPAFTTLAEALAGIPRIELEQ